MLVTNIRSVVVLFFCISFSGLANLSGQDAEFSKLIEAGEFSVALQSAATQSDPLTRDQMYRQIARAQRQSDTGLSAFSTAAMIQGDQDRLATFQDLTTYMRRSGSLGDNGFGGDRATDQQNPGGGSGGGVTEQDFEELMDLIQETINPDSWEANGGTGRMRPFPSGVFVDSKGTLKRIQRDASGRLDNLRELSANELDNQGLWQDAELRKISLSRLERELQRRAAVGEDISPDLKHLAGIYQLKYVMLYPQTGDVVIAGPAGPWQYDQLGRAVNTRTGQPVLNLDDLVVCLRNARQNNGQFTCSIDPRQENLEAARAFIETSTLKGRVWRDKLQETLGQMDVTVDGIDPTTHAARVIVEADYRMKLIGLGVENGVSGLQNYFDRIHLDESGNLPPVDQLVRWWFTMNYDSVQTNADRTIFELNGQGVRLLSESEFWDARGRRVHTGKSSAAARGFAEDFSQRFPEIASEHTVFGELKNVFDCAIAASLIHNEGLDRKVNWNLSFLDGSTRPGMLSYELQGEQVPTQVDSILGQRVLTWREGRRSRRHTISGFGGGVVFNASEHTRPEKIEVVSTTVLDRGRDQATPVTGDPLDWSWD